MAEVFDLDDSTSEIEAVEQKIAKQEPEVTPEAPKPDIPELPEKYRGKSVEDVVKMHQEAEKLASRHAQEVGEVRKLADELLKSQLKPKAEPEKPVEIDYFSDPQEAVRQAIESNPKVIAAEQYAVMSRNEQSRQHLTQVHPDVNEIVQDVDFVKYVNASPVRQKLFHEANINYDFDAGNELLSTYKELKAVKQVTVQVSEVDKEARKQAISAASVETGGTNETSKKIFRRADLIRLNMRDPARYEAMSDEIFAAYKEGRVK